MSDDSRISSTKQQQQKKISCNDMPSSNAMTKTKVPISPKHNTCLNPKLESTTLNRLNHWKSEKTIRIEESDASIQHQKAKPIIIQYPQNNKVFQQKKAKVKPSQCADNKTINSKAISLKYDSKQGQKLETSPTKNTCKSCQSLNLNCLSLEKKLMELQQANQKMEAQNCLLKQQNEQLMKKLTHVAAENKKLIREKVEKFKTESEDLKQNSNLKSKVMELEDKICQMEKEKPNSWLGQKSHELRFANLISVIESQIVFCPGQESNLFFQQFHNNQPMQNLAQSQICRMIQSNIDNPKDKTHYISTIEHQNVIKKIKKQFDCSLEQIALQFCLKQKDFESQLQIYEKDIENYKEKLFEFEKKGQCFEQISGEKVEMEKVNPESLVVGPSSVSKKCLNAKFLNKLDRIKLISEKQKNLFARMRQSLKVGTQITSRAGTEDELEEEDEQRLEEDKEKQIFDNIY